MFKMIGKEKWYIGKKGDNQNLSNGFNSSEFECRCANDNCVMVLMNMALIDNLEKLRNWMKDEFNKPIVLTVLSGNRCISHNKAVGGTEKSRHVKCDAADIGFNVPITEALLDKVKELFDGVGYYPKKRFLHLDVRGHKAFWKG